MAPDRRAILKAVSSIGSLGLAASLAGCSGGEDGDTAGTPTGTEPPDETSTETPMTTPTGTPTETSTATSAPLVRVSEHGSLGDVLTDADGRTLYIFTPDEEGRSVCTGGCAEAWPPLTVDAEADISAGPDVAAELGSTEREDGAIQVTADGHPLYYFASDGGPGDANGQEVGNVWFVLRPDGAPLKPTVSVRSLDSLGDVLTDADGRTLYIFTPDGEGQSTCTGDCATAWPPLTVESPDALVDSVRADVELDTTEREDGSTQVTANGRPLYYFANDGEPGDANGQGVNDVWFVLRPDGSVVENGGGGYRSG